jgi:toxin FitB
MYLADTNVISETKRERPNDGVLAFFREAECSGNEVHLSVVTVAELRQGVERLSYRGDAIQARGLDKWVNQVLQEYDGKILPADKEVGRLWGRLRALHPEPALDKLIAATAMVYGLTVVTRNVRDFEPTGVLLFNPFEDVAASSLPG